MAGGGVGGNGVEVVVLEGLLVLGALHEFRHRVLLLVRIGYTFVGVK